MSDFDPATATAADVVELIAQLHEAESKICEYHEDLLAALRTLRSTWSAEVDAANDAGIETPTMPIRAAVGALDVVLGGEPE